MKRVLLTPEGAERFRAELKEMRQVKRPAIIAAIAEARSHGDLKENAEYHAAREQQSFVEGQIKQIESILSEAQIIDVTQMSPNGQVIFGATVDLVDLDTDAAITYRIVGDIEADISQSKISVDSPIARAMFGKKVDDIVEVNAPSGVREYKITAIRYC